MTDLHDRDTVVEDTPGGRRGVHCAIQTALLPVAIVQIPAQRPHRATTENVNQTKKRTATGGDSTGGDSRLTSCEVRHTATERPRGGNGGAY